MALVLAAMPAVVLAQDAPQDVPDDTTSDKGTDEAGQGPQSDSSSGNYDPQTNLMTVVEPRREVEAIGASPLGDDYDPVTGTVTFSATDISLPGNFDIPVELRRWVPSDDYDTGGPSGWKWDIPFIRGHFLDLKDGHVDQGWDWGSNTWRHGKNCSGSADVVLNPNGDLIAGNAYWQGKLLHIPGVTSETFLDTADGQQVTKSNFRIVSCISNGDGQEGIVVAGPNGLTYTFNQLKTYYNGKTALKDPIVRTRLLLVTKIEDRFGNHVDYGYANGALVSISASDGRAISVSATSATAHGRTWTYTGTSKGLVVGLPDGSQWKYEGTSALAFKPNGTGGYSQQVRIGVSGQPDMIPGCSTAPDDYTVKVTMPSGLLTTYVFRDTVHYRSDVDPEIYNDVYMQDYSVTRALHCTIARSLVSKTLSGPGIENEAGTGIWSWTYQYSGNKGTYTADSGLNGYLTGPFDLPAPVGGYPSPITTGTAVNYRSTTIAGPDQRLVFYIDRKFQSISESRVIAQDVLNAAGTQLLQRQEYSFALGDFVGMHWYLCPCDGTPPVNESQLSHRINQTQSVEKRYVSGGTDTFTSTSANFDAYGFAQTRQGFNSFSGNVRTVQTSYLHDTANGLIGLPLTETVNGVLASQHHYNALGQRDWTRAFGKLQSVMTYNADGTLATVKDGNNRVTTFGNWKRGIPQSIQYADTHGQTAQVNDAGWIEWVVNEAGSKTCYEYDAMGRIAKITYPSETQAGVCNDSAWTPTTQAFEPVATAEYGIAKHHWRQTVTTGTAVKITYFDALWRPLVVREYDSSDEAGTKRFQRYAHLVDEQGRMEFASYPGTTHNLSTGVWTTYDALGRVTSVGQDSELGSEPLLTTTEYLGGFTTKVTNPRNKSTTTSYLTYDQPSTDWPVSIAAPEGQTTTISRDAFGKPTAISRGGVTRSYTYNASQELCRSVEPETGTTLYGYDGAGNLTWSAAGLPGGTACHATGDTGTINARKVMRSYDARNRLHMLSFPDGNGDQTWTYTADGLPATVVTYNGGQAVTNTYSYNKRRLLAGEAMQPDASFNWTMGYGYNGLGQVVAETLPAGVTVGYTVNALGQVTQASVNATGGSPTVVASGATYYPNGALKQFTYGNGIVHKLTQNARQLPSLSVDCAASTSNCTKANRRLHLTYAYDENGNVAGITDGTAGARQTRTMQYDGLDRLTGVTSSMFGTASYGYNALDNLTHVAVGASLIRTARDHYYCYNASNQLDFVRSGPQCTGNASPAVIALTYDVQGNLASKNGAGFTFDYGNRLRGDSTGQAYRYDAQGRRVKQDVAGAQQRYSFYAKDGRLVWQRDEVSGQRIHNVYFAGSLVAEFSRPIGGSAETITYQHTDALGSPIARTNASKAIIETSEYEPYGALVNRLNNDRPGYTGHVMDSATGLTYMQQRYYDPQIGRFLSRDPVTAYSNGDMRFFNAYAYAFNNPYKFNDPDGRSGVAALGGVITESWNWLNGRGFDGAMVMGALKDGYNGEGDGVVGAVIEDASAVATVAGGVGLLREVGTLAARQGGKEVIAQLTKGAVKDDVKGGVRQVVKTGGEKQMGRDMAQASKGARTTSSVETPKGVVRTAEHTDGTTVSARNFSSDGRPTVQVNTPKVDEVVKVRYDP